jgi:hypothetical protein
LLPPRALAPCAVCLHDCALCAPVRYRSFHTRLSTLNSARCTETIRGRIANPLTNRCQTALSGTTTLPTSAS